ncbi:MULTISPECIES: preprotein translocase subunit SecA [unclassified Fusibacter]|uniref:preprotein translocase subunit SecA n=1 Tax=unclassified Fusibacter TaxID=2624464 RepID=UPI0013E99253|nr:MULTISPECIES: preprotein translocase subunit SecA [unclassified Fusibacter]MCK8059434.1 preprotein translocase subunit SecA [Fusibacter sp. A2]NPE21102.1 preprotein translocase subunit SecA [Fusibacter sp. A1]
MGFQDWMSDKLSQKEIKQLYKEVEKIEALEPMMKAKSDEELQAMTGILKDRYKKGETLDDLLYESFALVREAAVRTLGKRHYPVQLLGGIVLHQGRIAEMKTGEGKTMVATLPSFLNALTGDGVHVVTVNDYLAKRDRDWMGKVHEFLGLTVGCLTNDVQGEERSLMYMCDITYGTNNEFGFDYLRDNMVVHQERLVQKKLNYAIIDEVDSILVDEARTPLIISGNGRKSTNLYGLADQFVVTLKKEVDFSIEEKEKSIVLTDEGGVVKAEKFFNIENLSDPENMELSHHINQALRARFTMKRDVDYVVKDGEILIVDEFTGRLMNGRRYSNGLHQAIESKEGLEVRRESQTLATITLQNYFRQYNKLSGMTGTAKTEEDEFKHIYGMDVVIVPTNKPIARVDMQDVVFKSLKGKYDAVIEEITNRYQSGQPILVGTITIEVSEYLSSLLKKRGIKHEVLNAKHHDREAEIVAQAGRFGAITIATNMAGRGTDIILGGNPEFMALKEMRKRGYSDDVLNKVTSPLDYHDDEIRAAKEIYNTIFSGFKAETDIEAEKVKNAGGLHIIGTERHESRRIDNQLRGRAGRQGDQGSTQFYISFEDDLMRLFLSDRIKGMVDKLGMEDEMQIEAKMLTKSIEGAQKKVEGRNFGIRKHVLQYDDVINKQREIIYGERQSVLRGDNLKDHIWTMVEDVIDSIVDQHTSASQYVDDWNLKALEDHLHQVMFVERMELPFDANLTVEDLKAKVIERAKAFYDKLESEIPEEKMREIERYVLLKVVDDKWIDHIDAMDQLKQGMNLRAIGQQDPVKTYQIEGFDMFNEMIHNIKEDTVKMLFHASVKTETKREEAAVIQASHQGDLPKKSVKRKEEKVGRNDPCPCGSGKKFKKCHGIDL